METLVLGHAWKKGREVAALALREKEFEERLRRSIPGEKVRRKGVKKGNGWLQKALDNYWFRRGEDLKIWVDVPQAMKRERARCRMAGS